MTDQRASFGTNAHSVWSCGCVYDDGEQTRWCAHHVSGMQETIVARERSITDLRYDLIGAQSSAKVAEDKAGMYQSLMEQAIRERDEWKAKAERIERAQEITHRALEAEIDRTFTHYCCMHQRWETREGAEV